MFGGTTCNNEHQVAEWHPPGEVWPTVARPLAPDAIGAAARPCCARCGQQQYYSGPARDHYGQSDVMQALSSPNSGSCCLAFLWVLSLILASCLCRCPCPCNPAMAGHGSLGREAAAGRQRDPFGSEVGGPRAADQEASCGGRQQRREQNGASLGGMWCCLQLLPVVALCWLLNRRLQGGARCQLQCS